MDCLGLRSRYPLAQCLTVSDKRCATSCLVCWWLRRHAGMAGAGLIRRQRSLAVLLRSVHTAVGQAEALRPLCTAMLAALLYHTNVPSVVTDHHRCCCCCYCCGCRPPSARQQPHQHPWPLWLPRAQRQRQQPRLPGRWQRHQPARDLHGVPPWCPGQQRAHPAGPVRHTDQLGDGAVLPAARPALQQQPAGHVLRPAHAGHSNRHDIHRQVPRQCVPPALRHCLSMLMSLLHVAGAVACAAVC